MKPLQLLFIVLACAGCTNFPELEGRELADVKTTRFPKLVPLQEALGPTVDPVEEATAVEEDLNTRREALEKKAQELQDAEIN